MAAKCLKFQMMISSFCNDLSCTWVEHLGWTCRSVILKSTYMTVTLKLILQDLLLKKNICVSKSFFLCYHVDKYRLCASRNIEAKMQLFLFVKLDPVEYWANITILFCRLWKIKSTHYMIRSFIPIKVFSGPIANQSPMSRIRFDTFMASQFSLIWK